MEKLYVFSEPQYKRLREVHLTPQEIDFHRVYREMIRTLHRKDLTDDEKWDLYSDLFSKYLAYVRSDETKTGASEETNQAKPVTVAAAEEEDQTSDGAETPSLKPLSFPEGQRVPYFRRRSLMLPPHPNSAAVYLQKSSKKTVKKPSNKDEILSSPRRLRGRNKGVQTERRRLVNRSTQFESDYDDEEESEGEGEEEIGWESAGEGEEEVTPPLVKGRKRRILNVSDPVVPRKVQKKTTGNGLWRL